MLLVVLPLLPLTELLAADHVEELHSERAQILSEIDERGLRLDALTAEMEGRSGEEYLIILGLVGALEEEILDLFEALVENVESAEEAGMDNSALAEFFEVQMAPATLYLINLVEVSESEIQKLAQQRESTAPAKLLEFEDRMAEYNGRIDQYYEMLLILADQMERVSLDSAPALDYVQNYLPARADRLMGRITLTSAQIQSLEDRIADGETDADTAAELRAANAKLGWTTASLAEATRVLDLIDYPTAPYRQVLIRTTGLTEDIFDLEVAQGLFDEFLDSVLDWLGDNGVTIVFQILVFIVIVMVSRVLGNLAGNLVRRGLDASGMKASDVLKSMFASIVSRTILLLGLLFGISQLGVEIGPVLAGIGIIGFAVGFALQETLSNFAAGTMLLVYRPFDSGDVISAGGVTGTVSELSLVNTTLHTFDNRQIVVPNSKIWGDIITNVTAQEERRVDITVRVSPEESTERVEQALAAVIAADDRVLSEPAPNIRINKLDDAAVEYIIRPWAARDDYWNLYWDLNRAIKVKFEDEGIRLAFEQRRLVVESSAS
jgi:small conductance mechanosensitive channel